MGRVHVVISGEGFTSCTVRVRRSAGSGECVLKLQVGAPIIHYHHLQLAVILALLQFLAALAFALPLSLPLYVIFIQTSSQSSCSTLLLPHLYSICFKPIKFY